MGKEKQEIEPASANLRIYEQARLVPKSAIKPITDGRLKGKSDINPMFRIKRMTEIFGPCGFGWKYEIVKQWLETYGNEVKAFTQINIYIKMDGEWSDAIPGVGGASFVSVEKRGPYVNDECYKMSLTDAMSVAMKSLGVAADIYYAKDGNNLNPGDSKYSSNGEADDTDLPTALQEIAACTNREELNAVWMKWGKIHPEYCQQGTEFYNATAEVGKTFK
jgi:hypothetical protein